MDIKTLELNDGEFVGIGAIEITSIPTLTILRDSYPQSCLGSLLAHNVFLRDFPLMKPKVAARHTLVDDLMKMKDMEKIKSLSLQKIYKFFKEEAENGFIWKES